MNLSKLLADTCGGMDESNVQVHAPRDSIKLNKRQMMVDEHNRSTKGKHKFQTPQTSDDPVLCTICGATSPDGWRRFQSIARKSCPLAR